MRRRAAPFGNSAAGARARWRVTSSALESLVVALLTEVSYAEIMQGRLRNPVLRAFAVPTS